jgi:hypothetical protein
MTFTAGELPYWMPANKKGDKEIYRSKFAILEDILNYFRMMVDMRQIKE